MNACSEGKSPSWGRVKLFGRVGLGCIICTIGLTLTLALALALALTEVLLSRLCALSVVGGWWGWGVMAVEEVVVMVG